MEITFLEEVRAALRQAEIKEAARKVKVAEDFLDRVKIKIMSAAHAGSARTKVETQTHTEVGCIDTVIANLRREGFEVSRGTNPNTFTIYW